MIDIPKWVTEKHVVSDVEDLTTATTTRNIRNINGVFLSIMVMVCGDST